MILIEACERSIYHDLGRQESFLPLGTSKDGAEWKAVKKENIK